MRAAVISTHMVSPSKPAATQSFFHDVLAVGTTRVSVMVVSFLTGVLVARLLGAEGKGLVAALTVAPAIVVTICDLGLMHATAYHIGRRTLPIERIVGALLSIGLLASLLAVAACLVYFRVTWLPEYTWLLVALATATIPMAIFRSYAIGVFLGRQQIANFNRAHWIGPLIRLALVVALVALLGWGAGGVLVAQLLAGAVIGVYALKLVRRLAPLRMSIDLEASRHLISLGLSFAASLFVMTLLYRINIVLLQHLGTLEELGVYTVGANLAEYIWQIPSALTAVVFSRGTNSKDPDRYSGKVLILFRITLLAAVIGSLAVAIAAVVLVPLLYGPQFEASVAVLWVMLPGVTAFIVYKVLNLDLAARGKPRIAMAMSIPALALNIGLGLWLIPRYGAIGAGAASSLTYVAAALLFLFLYCRELGITVAQALTFRKEDFRFLLSRLPLRRLRLRVST